MTRRIVHFLIKHQFFTDRFDYNITVTNIYNVSQIYLYSKLYCMRHSVHVNNRRGIYLQNLKLYKVKSLFYLKIMFRLDSNFINSLNTNTKYLVKSIHLKLERKIKKNIFTGLNIKNSKLYEIKLTTNPADTSDIFKVLYLAEIS